MSVKSWVRSWPWVRRFGRWLLLTYVDEVLADAYHRRDISSYALHRLDARLKYGARS